MKKTITLILSLGLIFLTNVALAQTTLSLYEYYNASKQKHFYTTSFGELGNGANGWSLVQTICKLTPTSNIDGSFFSGYNKAVYRYFSTGSNEAHYYTINFGVHPSTFTSYEGIIGYASAGNTLPISVAVYEYYKTSNGDYVYTTQVATPAGYVKNGVAFYGINNSAIVTP